MTDRFSLHYLKPGAPAPDSIRARRRVAANFNDLQKGMQGKDTFAVRVVEEVHSELGTKVPFGNYSYSFDQFFEKCELRDFLDSVSVIVSVLNSQNAWRQLAVPFLQIIERIFKEENLSYRLDANGVVHYRVDEEFERNISSSLAALSAETFAQTRAAFERSKTDLEQATPNTIGAIRNMFEAAESLHKRITGSNADLTEAEVAKTLRPFVDRAMSGSDAVARSAAGRFVSSFAGWVNAAHPYRHGHNADAPVEPPLHFAIALVSNGAGFIRWLATLDGERG